MIGSSFPATHALSKQETLEKYFIQIFIGRSLAVHRQSPWITETHYGIFILIIQSHKISRKEIIQHVVSAATFKTMQRLKLDMLVIGSVSGNSKIRSDFSRIGSLPLWWAALVPPQQFQTLWVPKSQWRPWSWLPPIIMWNQSGEAVGGTLIWHHKVTIWCYTMEWWREQKIQGGIRVASCFLPSLQKQNNRSFLSQLGYRGLRCHYKIKPVSHSELRPSLSR